MNKAFDQIYTSLNAQDNDDIYITSCSTESNNTVLKSILFSDILKKKKTQIISSSVEHPAIADTCEFLKEFGAKVDYLPG
jgi:cysteine desulfurase